MIAKARARGPREKRRSDGKHGSAGCNLDGPTGFPAKTAVVTSPRLSHFEHQSSTPFGQVLDGSNTSSGQSNSNPYPGNPVLTFDADPWQDLPEEVAVLADVLVTHCRITRRRVVPVVALQCCFVSFAIEMHCGLPLPQHPFLCCAVPFWTTSIDQFVLASIRPARATISIGRRAPSAAPHWMRRAARLCVASLTLYFVRQRPDTKGAPPLYLTPLPNGPFPWCPPD